MKTSERNFALDRFEDIKQMINVGKINYSINQYENDYKKFKFKSWVVCNKFLTFIIVLILSPITVGLSFLGWVLLLIMSASADKGYKNYIELVEKYKNIVNNNETNADKS